MSRSRTQRRLVALAALVALASSGCTDGTGPASIEGEYVLRSVNGSALPYTRTYSATTSYTIRSQRVGLLTGASWTSATSHRYVYPGLLRDETNELDGGSYTRDESAGTLLLRSGATASTYPGRVSGRTLTLYRDGDVYRYER